MPEHEMADVDVMCSSKLLQSHDASVSYTSKHTHSVGWLPAPPHLSTNKWFFFSNKSARTKWGPAICSAQTGENSEGQSFKKTTTKGHARVKNKQIKQARARGQHPKGERRLVSPDAWIARRSAGALRAGHLAQRPTESVSRRTPNVFFLRSRQRDRPSRGAHGAAAQQFAGLVSYDVRPTVRRRAS